MKEIWKEFFRLKAEEIGDWFKYEFIKSWIPAIIAIIVCSHFMFSLVFFLDILFGDGGSPLFGLPFLIYPCAFLIWVCHKTISWLLSNWEQAKKNVARRNK